MDLSGLAPLLPLSSKYHENSSLSIAGENFVSYCSGYSVNIVDRIQLSWWETMTAMASTKNNMVRLRHHSVPFYEGIDFHRAESLLLLWTSILKDLIKEEIDDSISHVHRSQKAKDQTAFILDRRTALEIINRNAETASEEIKKITSNLKYPPSLNLGTSEETRRLALQKVENQRKSSKEKL